MCKDGTTGDRHERGDQDPGDAGERHRCRVRPGNDGAGPAILRAIARANTAFGKVRDGISPDGLFPRDRIENTLKMPQTFNPEVAVAKMRIDDTCTNRFVERALANVKKP